MVTVTSPAEPDGSALTATGGKACSTLTSRPCTVWLKAERLLSLAYTVTPTPRVARGRRDETARRSWKLWPGLTQAVCCRRLTYPLGGLSAPAPVAPTAPVTVSAAPPRASAAAVRLARRQIMVGCLRSTPIGLAAPAGSRGPRTGQGRCGSRAGC